MPGGDAPEWHEVLMRLRDHYTDPVSSPRERFTVAVTQDVEGNPSGVAITSARQPSSTTSRCARQGRSPTR